MSYCYGLSVIHSHLLRGAGLILTDRSIVDDEFWTLFRRHRGTSFAGVPYTFEMLERIGFDGIDLPDLRYVTQAGGRLTPERVAASQRSVSARAGSCSSCMARRKPPPEWPTYHQNSPSPAPAPTDNQCCDRFSSAPLKPLTHDEQPGEATVYPPHMGAGLTASPAIFSPRQKPISSSQQCGGAGKDRLISDGRGEHLVEELPSACALELAST